MGSDNHRFGVADGPQRPPTVRHSEGETSGHRNGKGGSNQIMKTVRLQVDILRQQLEELESLQKLGGLRSKRELWDTAFTLLKWATKKKTQGFSVGSMSPDGRYTELEMPFLEDLARSVRTQKGSDRTQDRIPVGRSKTSTAGMTAQSRKNGVSHISVAKRRQTA